mmetsp:Transcript_17391/g.42590  ORF Transcript_17391/g.42590 Transcript_17391/m.42590 type:complete len:405 (-) Transcript_17391:344-1558(-)
MAASNFWITTERLKLAGFTTSVDVEKIYLFIPRPNESSASGSIFAPFSPRLWGTLVASMVFVALLLPLLADHDSHGTWCGRLQKEKWKEATILGRAWIATSVGLDSLLETLHGFFSGAPIYERGFGFPSKLLLVGYGFLVLVAVASYTANLAAFLSEKLAANYIGSMEEAIFYNAPICGHPALKEDLLQAWPEANFIYNEEAENYYTGMIEDYQNKKCDMLATAIDEILDDDYTFQLFCDMNLVSTGLVLEKQIAFPINPKYGGGFSKYFLDAANQGIIMSDYKRSGVERCSLKLNDFAQDEEDNPQLDVSNFSLPLFFLLATAVAAVAIKFCGAKRRRMGTDTIKLQTSTKGVVLERDEAVEKPSMMAKLEALAHLQDKQERLRRQQEDALKELMQQAEIDGK